MTKDGEVISEKSIQFKRYVKYLFKLYSRIFVAVDEVIDAIPSKADNYQMLLPDMKELSQIRDNFILSGKAPCKGPILVEALKCGENVLLPHLHTLLIRI